MQKNEIRKAYLLNKYVIVTPKRATRPRDIKEHTIIERTESCPFCVEQINKKNIIDQINSKKNWQILSIKNIFPAVTLNNPRAYGTQEVIIETPNHNKKLADLSISHIEKLLHMYAKRTKELSQNHFNSKIKKKLDYILCFKNQGSKSGASIIHAHSQIFATAMIPPEVQKESMLANNYKIEHNRCPYCDIIKKEIKSPRKIWADKNIVAFTPFASEYHYEAWIFPCRHLDNITLLEPEEIKSLAQALKIILLKLQKLNLSFNYFLHNIVSDKDQHFYIKIQPRDSVWAGVELGSGLVINSVPPEAAAKYYRK